MSGVKRAAKALVTGGLSEAKYAADKAKREADKAAEEQRLQAEEDARKQRELEAAQEAASSANMAEVEGTELGAADTQSKQKKKISSGKKSLSIARSSGSGINI